MPEHIVSLCYQTLVVMVLFHRITIFVRVCALLMLLSARHRDTVTRAHKTVYFMHSLGLLHSDQYNEYQEAFV